MSRRLRTNTKVAQIRQLLLADAILSIKAIAERVGCHPHQVYGARAALVREGLLAQPGGRAASAKPGRKKQAKPGPAATPAANTAEALLATIVLCDPARGTLAKILAPGGPNLVIHTDGTISFPAFDAETRWTGEDLSAALRRDREMRALYASQNAAASSN